MTKFRFLSATVRNFCSEKSCAALISRNARYAFAFTTPTDWSGSGVYEQVDALGEVGKSL